MTRVVKCGFGLSLTLDRCEDDYEHMECCNVRGGGYPFVYGEYWSLDLDTNWHAGRKAIRAYSAWSWILVSHM